jgi:hypothetical protein
MAVASTARWSAMRSSAASGVRLAEEAGEESSKKPEATRLAACRARTFSWARSGGEQAFEAVADQLPNIEEVAHFSVDLRCDGVDEAQLGLESVHHMRWVDVGHVLTIRCRGAGCQEYARGPLRFRLTDSVAVGKRRK